MKYDFYPIKEIAYKRQALISTIARSAKLNAPTVSRALKTNRAHPRIAAALVKWAGIPIADVLISESFRAPKQRKSA